MSLVVAHDNQTQSGECPPWTIVRLADVLVQQKREVAVDAAEEYRLLGAHWYAKGLYVKDTKPGSQIKAAKLYRVEQGDFVYNRLFAWKGSFAVADSTAHGCYVSNEFPTFTARQDRVDSSFLWWYFSRQTAWNEALGVSYGATPTSRNRLKERDFLAMEIPLPSVHEQRRIVTKIERLGDKVNQAREMRREACERVRVLLASVLSDAFPQPTNSTVATYAKVQSGYAFKSAWFTEDGIRLARNANVSHGALDWSDTARIPKSMRGEYERFELAEGDILISLDRPLISTGLKVARVTQADLPCLLLQRVGRFQFHSDEVLPEYLYHWLHSPHFVHSIDPGRSNGVPHISQKDIERIPFVAPSVAEQRDTIAKLDAVYEQVRSVERLQQKTATELDALLPSILDKAFKGEL